MLLCQGCRPHWCRADFEATHTSEALSLHRFRPLLGAEEDLSELAVGWAQGEAEDQRRRLRRALKRERKSEREERKRSKKSKKKGERREQHKRRKQEKRARAAGTGQGGSGSGSGSDDWVFKKKDPFDRGDAPVEVPAAPLAPPEARSGSHAGIDGGVVWS